MFEKVGRRAEEFATRLPRRAFFGKVAQAALPVAAALGGLLVLSRDAHAVRFGRRSCCYDNFSGKAVCRVRRNEGCPDGTQWSTCGPNDQPPWCYQ